MNVSRCVSSFGGTNPMKHSLKRNSDQSICSRQTLMRFSGRIRSSKGETAVYGSNQAIC